MKLPIVFFLIILFFPIQAFGQICSISHHPYGFVGANRPQMQVDQFLEIEEDLPFHGDRPGKRYAQFWVNTDVLNIRSGPGLGYDVVLETYFGEHIFAYAKQGDWIAIDSGVQIGDMPRPPYWVNVKYLTGKRLRMQVDIDVLKQRCSFENFGVLKFEWPPNRNTPHQCKSVQNYLMKQVWVSQKHQYGKDYNVWRDMQRDSTKFRKLACY